MATSTKTPSGIGNLPSAVRIIHRRLGDRWWQREHDWPTCRDLVRDFVAAGHSPLKAVVLTLDEFERAAKIRVDRELARCRSGLVRRIVEAGDIKAAAERYYVECYGHVGTTVEAQKRWRSLLVGLYRGCEMLGLDATNLPR